MVTGAARAYDSRAVRLPPSSSSTVRHRLPRFSPATVRGVALGSVICYGLLILSGGAVRLTGSGLGCPDWPSCYQHHLTAVSSFHPVVEFANRLVSVAVTLLSGAAFAVAALRRPPRRELTWLAAGLVGGIVAQIVLGGLVVLFKLNPYLVALHFLLTIVILADAIVLYHLSGSDPTPAEPVVSRDLVHLSRLLLGTLALVTVIGTVVSGAGPHAGSTAGSVAKRIPIAFRDIAELHSDAALFLIGLTLASMFAFHHAKAPPVVQRRAHLFMEVMVVQGALGYLQYFLHDSALVVEFHLAGVTTLWIAGVGLYLSLHRHPRGAGVQARVSHATASLAVGT
jgi:cytochrome c oxidase assembly protein subunit 15